MSTEGGVPPSREAVLEHLDALSRWCRRQSADWHLVEDVVQETLLAAIRRIGTVRDRRHLRGWLLRVAQRRFADAYRTTRPWRPLTAEPAAPEGDETDGPVERGTRLQVRRLLRRLPLRLRRAVRMHYLEGRPLREVASRLDTTINGVKSRLYRARQLLRQGERT